MADLMDVVFVVLYAAVALAVAVALARLFEACDLRWDRSTSLMSKWSRLNRRLRILAVAVIVPSSPLVAQRYAPLIRRIAVLADLTQSSIRNNTPALQPEDLTPFIQLLADSGGELGVSAVRAKAMGGILRLWIDRPAPPPTRPELRNVPIFQQRSLMDQYRSDSVHWATTETHRRAEAVVRINIFNDKLTSLLRRPRLEDRSDVYLALVQLDRFLLEPADTPNASIRRLYMIVSDLQDTRSHKVDTLRSNPVTAWVVRGERPIGRLPGVSSPVLFEAVRPATAWLMTQAQSPDNR